MKVWLQTCKTDQSMLAPCWWDTGSVLGGGWWSLELRSITSGTFPEQRSRIRNPKPPGFRKHRPLAAVPHRGEAEWQDLLRDSVSPWGPWVSGADGGTGESDKMAPVRKSLGDVRIFTKWCPQLRGAEPQHIHQKQTLCFSQEGTLKS